MSPALTRTIEWLTRSYSEQPLSNLDQWMEVGQYGSYTSSGEFITGKRAFSCPPAYACIDLLSRVASVLPGGVFKRIEDGTRDRELDRGHYLYPLVHDRANPVNSAGEWRRLVSANIDGWGNHYSWIEWDRRPWPRALWPLPPECVKVERDSATSPIRYYVKDNKTGTWVEFPASDILHIKDLGDGTVGWSRVQLMAETLGLAFAEQDSASKMHKNGITTKLVLETPGNPTPEQTERIRESLHKATTGNNQWKAIVLGSGYVAKPMSINPRDAQMLELGQYTDEKIYQIFGTPPHLVGDTTKATSWGSGIEQLTIGYVTFRVVPLVNLIETAIEQKLLPDGDDHFVEFDVKGILRGDTKARAEWYKTMIDSGVYTPNRVLRAENEEPFTGGDFVRMPINNAFLDTKTGKITQIQPPGGAQNDQAPNN